jgi:hypothetical protein
LPFEWIKFSNLIGVMPNTPVLNQRLNKGPICLLVSFGSEHFSKILAQFNDAITTVKSKVNAVTVAILDGVPYIESKNKMCKSIRSQNKHNIMRLKILPHQ